MSTPATQKVRTARRWFWIMVVTAAAAMGVLYRTVRADPAPAVGLLFMLSTLVVLASVVQASRIWVALEGPARLRRGAARGMPTRIVRDGRDPCPSPPRRAGASTIPG